MIPSMETDERHRLATMAAPTGIFLLDAAGDVAFVNPRLCEIFHATEAELSASGFARYLHPDDRDRATTRFTELVVAGDGARGDYRLLRSDGAEAWVRVWSAPIRDDDGTIAGIAGVLADITAVRAKESEARLLESKLQQAQKLESLGVLAGGVAHDLNNVLMGIMGNVALAEMDITPGSNVAEALSDLRLAAERATELTAELLAYSGRGTIATQPVDLTTAIEETHTQFRSTNPKHPQVTLELARQLPNVAGDPGRLRQLVLTLLTNAAEALGETRGEFVVRTGTVVVDAAQKARLTVDGGLELGIHVLLEVRDGGCGMTAATLARIFDPFFTTKKRKGRGLGLAASVGTVRAQKAGLEVVTAPGAGTTFRLLLPIDTSHPSATPGRTTGARADGRGTILVVDDDSAVRDVTRRLLSRQGYEVLEAVDGLSAIEVLSASKERIGCVLLDMTMPGMDGAETFRQMCIVHPAVKVVVTSGHTAGALQERFTGSGIVGFLHKPFDLPTLLRATTEAIGS